MKIKLRKSQIEILNYQAGKMGISAVPGSGKTWTLSLLAADIISRGELLDDQEVLIVTLVNSAVDNFYRRVAEFINYYKLIPNLGYRVRTLHGLAHDIVRERPGLVGLADDFLIIDERESELIRRDVARAWLMANLHQLESYISLAVDEEKRDWVLRDPLARLVEDVCLSFIRYAKDIRLSPVKIGERLDSLPIALPLAEMGYEMYMNYQRALAYRGGVDFDDLIMLAYQALEIDGDYLLSLQHKWPYILEDEAQDSSNIQEQILALFVGKSGNWVRVGDPNQAIFETFTTANPRYLRQFVNLPDVQRKELSVSGRSTKSIISLANYLVNWVQNEYPVEVVRDALQSPPLIQLTPRDDPNPNPEDHPTDIYLILENKYTPQGELSAVVDSVERWLSKNADATVAILVPRNQRGERLVDELQSRNIPFVDSLLRSTNSTRETTTVITTLLNYLTDPQSSRKLAALYRVWRRNDSGETGIKADINQAAELIRKQNRVEKYIWPTVENDWTQELRQHDISESIISSISEFRVVIRRWQEAILLPIDQLVLIAAQDLLVEPSELALVHKLSILLRQAIQANPSWRIREFTQELELIARNERRFLGFSKDDTGFNPDSYKGKVVVSTMHKAKGLEWDRVYLLSVNDYNFPSGSADDVFISEKWFIRDDLNLQAESLEQLDALLNFDENYWYSEGTATQIARVDYIRERLRLLYVAITRAKRELIITYNSGRSGRAKPALPLIELYTYWNRNSDPRNKTNELAKRI